MDVVQVRIEPKDDIGPCHFLPGWELGGICCIPCVQEVKDGGHPFICHGVPQVVQKFLEPDGFLASSLRSIVGVGTKDIARCSPEKVRIDPD